MTFCANLLICQWKPSAGSYPGAPPHWPKGLPASLLKPWEPLRPRCPGAQVPSIWFTPSWVLRLGSMVGLPRKALMTGGPTQWTENDPMGGSGSTVPEVPTREQRPEVREWVRGVSCSPHQEDA